MNTDDAARPLWALLGACYLAMVLALVAATWPLSCGPAWVPVVALVPITAGAGAIGYLAGRSAPTARIDAIPGPAATTTSGGGVQLAVLVAPGCPQDTDRNWWRRP